MKRIVAFLLIVCTLFSCLFMLSCNSEPDEKTTEVSEELSTLETVEEAPDVIIAEGKEDIYTIIRFLYNFVKPFNSTFNKFFFSNLNST